MLRVPERSSVAPPWFPRIASIPRFFKLLVGAVVVRLIGIVVGFLGVGASAPLLGVSDSGAASAGSPMRPLPSLGRRVRLPARRGRRKFHLQA